MTSEAPMAELAPPFRFVPGSRLGAEGESPRLFVPGRAADAVVVEASDRMVQHLFEAGLQLHGLRAVFDRLDADPAQLCTASLAVAAVLDELDVLIHEASLAMLAHATARRGGGAPGADGAGAR
ncbi:hypothetical protein [Nocardia otitidiscaviarum]|nr:hypothetical protein [Nocardia otitidiscaviarum]